MSDWRVLEGDCVDVLRQLEAGSVQTCVTSPPYWGLRDYSAEGQLGLEPTPEQYVENLVAVFREVRRVLRDDGTVWLNLGDSYAGGHSGESALAQLGERYRGGGHKDAAAKRRRPPAPGLKAKDLVGIPWRVAFALQADGWWLRSDIIWAKPNPMPESVTDRPTRSHEYIFLLTKSARYFYDADAIREDATEVGIAREGRARITPHHPPGQTPDRRNTSNGDWLTAGRNRRSVWTVTTQPFPGAHFATFPPKLIEPCVLAGTPPKCCGKCGASWERIVERQNESTYARVQREEGITYKDMKAEAEANGITPGNVGGTHRPGKRGETFVSPENQTMGWRATCAHDDDSGTAIVLDPFAGAGTTGVVALRHGREFVGVELNPEYAEMARARIRAFEANPNGYLDAEEPVPGQLELLGD